MRSVSAKNWIGNTKIAYVMSGLCLCVTLLLVCSVPARVPAKGRHGCSSSGSSSVSGVSGKLFAGTKQRTYTGSRLWGPGSASMSRHSTPPAVQGALAKKWAVCTTIFKPSEAILGMIALEGWSVVIVGDKGAAPFVTTATNLVYLDVAAQQALSASSHGGLLNLLPWKHFGRKNVGYLYAIAHGAEVIWDFDDDNILKPGKQPAMPTSNIFSVDTGDCPAFNPYPVMGDPSAADSKVPPTWPRGFPLHLIRKPCNHSLVPDRPDQVAVVQSLADNDPDVDGIFRLTRGVPFNFNPGSKHTLVLPMGTLTPWNAQATLVMKPAFWSLLLPVTVHGRVSDIWRSYISQRLLWDIGYRVAFAPPLVNQFRSPHNYLADMQAEEALYYKSGQLVSFLREWQGTAPTIAGRYEELLVELYERQYLELMDVQLAQQWLLSLSAAGYSFPPVAEKAVVSPIQEAKPRCPKHTSVLITGVNGMIGSHVARVLVKKPCYRVHGLVRPRSNLDTLTGVLDKLNLVTGDITDAPRMLDVMEQLRPDYLYHFAAQSLNGISYSVPELTLDTNVAGTLNVLEAVRRAGLKPRVLLAGSSTEYGRTADTWEGAIPETAPLEPVSPYGVSKVATEQLGHQYNLSFAIPVITARYFIQVGVGGTDNLAIHQFCKQIAMAEAGLARSEVLHGNLDTKRDMSDIRDTAPLTVALAEQGVPGEAYNVGSGKEMSIHDLLKVAISQAHVPISARLDPARLRVYDEKTLLGDNSKARKVANWTPNTDMQQTVSSILDYWRRRVAVLYPHGNSTLGL